MSCGWSGTASDPCCAQGRLSPALLVSRIAERYLGQLSRLVSPWPGGPVCVPLGFTPLDFLGPQPGLYWLFDALPLCPPFPPPAITPPVPAAIRATVSSVAIVRDFTW